MTNMKESAINAASRHCTTQFELNASLFSQTDLVEARGRKTNRYHAQTDDT